MVNGKNKNDVSVVSWKNEWINRVKNAMDKLLFQRWHIWNACIFIIFRLKRFWVVRNFFENDIIQNNRKYSELPLMRIYLRNTYTQTGNDRHINWNDQTETEIPIPAHFATVFCSQKSYSSNPSRELYWSVHVSAHHEKQKQHKNSFGYSLVCRTARREMKTHKQNKD